jgi:small ligand-binding sensory domain FIST
VHWVSRISTAAKLETAVEEVSDAVLEGLGGADPDLAIVFVARQHRAGWVQLPRLLGERLGGPVLLGCSGAGIIGGAREVEQAAALSVVAAHLPGVELTPFHLSPETIPPPGTPTDTWNARLGLASDADASFLVLPDPLSTRAHDFVAAMDAAYPEATIVGGLASGGDQPGQHALMAGHEAYGSGVVGLALSGNIRVDSIVAQGCRPVGSPLFVTRADNQIVHQLDGRRPADVLQDLYTTLSEADRRLMRHSLSLGVVMTEGQQVYRQGDFLIRNIVGLDNETGAMAVAADLHKGQVVQFQLRDKQTSAADLEMMLARHVTAHPDRPAGALMFSCLGRGRDLYGEPDHDSGMFRRHVGPVPIGGFFCNGEIGPVAGSTFVHGYTSAFALFRRKQTD